MNILDEDMQMVRDFLVQANAPFHIASHFENLVSEHAKEAARVEDLQGQVDELEQNESDEIEKLTDERNALQSELDEIVDDGMRGALETVKYALHDIIYLGKPLQIMPRRLLEIVEDAL